MRRCAGDGLLNPELPGPKEPPGLEFLMQIVVETPLQRLVSLYEAWGKPQEAARYPSRLSSPAR